MEEGKKISFLLYFLICSLMTAATVWAMLFNYLWIIVIVFVLFCVLQFAYFQAFSLKLGCSSLFFIAAGLIAFFVAKEGYDQKFGVVYVLGNVSDRRTTYYPSQRSGKRYTRAHNYFEAVITCPVFGLLGKDSLKYEYSGSSEDLEKPFPIKGDYSVLRYAIAFPEYIECEILNPTMEEIIKYRKPVVITPDSTELRGQDAIYYIEDCIMREE